MIERIKRWWRGQDIRNMGDGDDMDDELRSIGYRSPQEIEEAKKLLRESRQKSQQASRRLADYQERIQREYDKRAEIAGAGRGSDADR